MSDEVPIGPNPCHGCGGEYGNHADNCRYIVRSVEKSEARTQWEYLYVYGDDFEVVKRANDYGIQGWEMINVVPDLNGKHVAYMKRRKSPA